MKLEIEDGREERGGGPLEESHSFSQQAADRKGKGVSGRNMFRFNKKSDTNIHTHSSVCINIYTQVREKERQSELRDLLPDGRAD